MSAKKWIWVFVRTAAAVALLFAFFNAMVDPFGIFGDRILNWWSYDMTQNPRTAKIGWLDINHSDYDSYVIGCSKTGAFSTELLNEYYDAKFYNMLMYGGDLYDSEMTVKYLLENYEVKNIIVNTGLSELLYFNGEDDNMKGNLHAKTDDSSLLMFYGKYLFANPKYAVDKLTAYANDSYLVNENKVFIPETGEFDKSLRDIEPIGSSSSYLSQYPAFLEETSPVASLPSVNACVESVSRMKQMCEDAGVSFTFVVSPLYKTDLDIYCNEDLFDFFRQLSQVTDFWDFSGYHSVANEARYFYDTSHYRNNVGVMMLAKMFQNTQAYVPEDFGVYVTSENVESRIFSYSQANDQVAISETELPILMYHSIADDTQNAYTVSSQLFYEQMEALKDAGYHTITFAQLIDYVETGAPLPENPIIVTFDDGYENNITVAAPILKELGMCAEISVIGVSVGKDSYKDTGIAMIPHFSIEDAASWISEGVIELGSHSYDMHQVTSLDGEDCRKGVFPLPDESEAEYISTFCDDFTKSKDIIEQAADLDVLVYSYPYGYHTDLTEVLLAKLGIKTTLTVDEGINTVVAGLPQSLRAMKRCNISSDMMPEDIIIYLEGLSNND